MATQAAVPGSGIEEVDRLDARGQHGEAIAALARAGGRGDLGAMATLGLRLLLGDRCPCLPEQGTRLLFDAAGRGNAAAQERCAALLAGGVHVRQDPRAALRLLGQAAAGGDQGARAQLSALSGQGDVPRDWPAVAASVDLQHWSRGPGHDLLSAEPLVSRIEGLLPGPVCDWLIDQSRPHLTRARVYDPIRRQEREHEMRSNTTATFGLRQVTALHFLVQARMAAACNVPLNHLEAPAVLHYDVGEEITPHFDFIDPRLPDYQAQVRAQGQRTHTFLAYLNADYEGGATDFPQLRVRHRGARGDGLLFANVDARGAPDLRMQHAGLPPTRGEKWLLSQFIRGNPAR